MEFCLILHLTNTSIDAKRNVKWQPILLPGMLVLLPTFILGSKYLLPARKVCFLTLKICCKVPLYAMSCYSLLMNFIYTFQLIVFVYCS